MLKHCRPRRRHSFDTDSGVCAQCALCSLLLPNKLINSVHWHLIQWLGCDVRRFFCFRSFCLFSQKTKTKHKKNPRTSFESFWRIRYFSIYFVIFIFVARAHLDVYCGRRHIDRQSSLIFYLSLHSGRLVSLYAYCHLPADATVPNMNGKTVQKWNEMNDRHIVIIFSFIWRRRRRRRKKTHKNWNYFFFGRHFFSFVVSRLPELSLPMKLNKEVFNI